MIIQSTRFGNLEVPKEQIYCFPDGLPGFPDENRFALLIPGQDNPFAFLQSTANPDLTFIIVEPFSFFKDYTFKLPDQVTQDLKLSNDNPPRIFNIVSIRDSIEKATTNLLAPIIVNWQNNTAMQIILEKSEYQTRHKLFPNGLKKASEGGR